MHVGLRGKVMATGVRSARLEPQWHGCEEFRFCEALEGRA